MKNIAGLILFSFLSVSAVKAQYNPEKISKKAVQQYELAMNKASEDNLREAATHLENAIRIDPKYADAFLSLAGIHGQFKEYNEAIALYEKARSLDPVYFMEYNLPYSINLAGKGDFEGALIAVTSFLAIPHLNETSRKAGAYREKCYKFALQYQKDHPAGNYRFAPVNMGPGINTADPEYFPSLTIDRKQLIFTRRINNYNEDFYESIYADGWQQAKGLTGDINTNLNEGAQNISQDGQMLVFTGCNFETGFGSCDIYYSIRTKNGWSEPMNIGRSINTEFWESQPCLSPDKTELYFSSRRPDGNGGSDLYVSRRQPNGSWSAPESLGPSINTAGDEYCPFIHADNETMYFMSNGHPGYGGDDLFMAKRNPDGTWGTPVNLGYPVNTIENEGSLFIASDGKTAYYASDRADGYGALDLYTFELRDEIRPAATSWIKGQVFDANTRQGLPSMVELTDLRTGRIVSRLQTDEDGNYLSTLPTGKEYAFSVNRKGYLFYSEHFGITHPQDSAYTRDIPLRPFEKEARLVLNNIFFDVNKYELKPESRIELDKLAQLLKENPNLKIRINGHTDNTGTKEANLTLSENRAKVIFLYLTGSRFIEKERLTYKGFGDSAPVAGNETEEGRAKNRRTEIEITGL